MKKIFSLLGLLICVMSAWGTLTPVSISYSSTSTTDGWSTSTGGRFDPAILNNDADGYFLSVNQGSRNNNGATVTGNVISGKAEAGDDFTVTFDLRISSSSNQTSTEFKILDATNGANIFSLKETGTWATTWIINGDGTKTVTLPNSNKAGSGNTITDVPWYSVKVCRKGTSTYLTISDKASGDAILTKEAISTQSENGGLGNIQFVSSRYLANFAINNIVVRAIQDGDAPAGPAYSIRYMLGSTVVKTESGEAPVGEKLTSKGEFWENNVKYFATNGVQEFTNTENPANNIFDVAIREANNYSYTVNAVSGTTLLKEIASGVSIEGEAVKVAYPIYVENGGKLYTKGATNKEFNYSFTPSASGNVNLEYSATNINNVVYYTEGEDIPGATVVSSGNAGTRSSHSAIGYGATEDLEMVTLPAGVYTFTGVGLFSSSGGGTMTITDKSGGEFIISGKSSNWSSATLENIVLSVPTTLYLAQGGGNTVGLDFFYAQKTADFVATTDLQINEAALEIGKSTTLTTTITPANATRKTVTWSIGIQRAKGVNKAAEPEEEYGEAEINAETGVITPIKAGWVYVNANNGEYSDTKQLYINPAEFAVAIEGAPSEAQVFVGEDASADGVLSVTTKEGYDQMQNTTRLQPQGSVTATEIATYIYTITVNKDKKTVDVVYEKDIEVTAMEFAVKDQRIAQGNSRTLQVTYYPADASFKTATWTSSNPEVATVDAKTGLVTAVSEGETTITATWSENESHGTDYSAEMTLTVDKGLVIDRIVFDELDDATAEVMGYYHPMDGDTLFLASHIESNGRMVPVSFIRYEAFIGSNLKSIVIPGTVKTIDHRALQYSNTHNAYEELPEDGLESAFLMEGVEVMRDRIFHGNKYMKKVFLPSTLTDIGYYSFFGTAIEDVFFGGSEDEWNALKNLENAKLPETAKIHFNSDFTSAFIDGIEVDEESVELEVGEQKTIGFIITPESIAPSVEVTFTSSDESVATVDETGVITAVADGFATITVSAGAGIEAKVRVKVGDPVQERENVLTMDFEDGEVADYWALAIAESQLVEPTAEGSTGRAAAVVSGSDRGDYVKVNADLEGATKYEVAMDLLLTKSPKTTQFCVLNASSWDSWITNWGMFWKTQSAQSHNPFLFNMDIPASNTANINIDFDADGNAIAAQQTWDYENGVWYTLKLTVDVNAHKVDYTIAAKSDPETALISGTYNAPADENMQIKGIYERNGRYNYSPGAIAIDNVIVDVTERGFVEGQGGNGATGISEAKADETVKNGKFVENGQIVIYIDGKKFNAAGQQMK